MQEDRRIGLFLGVGRREEAVVDGQVGAGVGVAEHQIEDLGAFHVGTGEREAFFAELAADAGAWVFADGVGVGEDLAPEFGGGGLARELELLYRQAHVPEVVVALDFGEFVGEAVGFLVPGQVAVNDAEQDVARGGRLEVLGLLERGHERVVFLGRHEAHVDDAALVGHRQHHRELIPLPRRQLRAVLDGLGELLEEGDLGVVGRAEDDLEVHVPEAPLPHDLRQRRRVRRELDVGDRELARHDGRDA
jgi:hypothetical protein